MARLLTTILVLALVTGTAAAFAVTESLKLQRSPIFRPRIDKVFSPVCRCDTTPAKVGFSLRRGDDLTLTIVDANGNRVATVTDSQRVRRGKRVFHWDGRNDAGRVVPDGVYRARVHLANQHRTILLPNEIVVDTRAPMLSVLGVRPEAFSPDGDRRADKIEVAYRVSEPAHVLLYVNGRRRVRGRWQRLEGALEWFGKVGGRAFPSGPYRLALVAEDLAGNRSPATPSRWVRIRFVALARDRIVVKARTRFGVRVDSDARTIRWRFAGRTGTAKPGLLVLRAPKAGRYVLFVEANGHGDRAAVVVRPRG